MIFLPILKVCITVYFSVLSLRKHTHKRTLKLFLFAVLFASHTTVSALSLVSPSHTYGTQSQHLQPGFPPLWRVCSLGFPGHKHQGETPLSTLALPGLGQQWNQEFESHPRGWASALRGHLPRVPQHPGPPPPPRQGDVGALARHLYSECPALLSSFETPVILGCNNLEVLRAPLCSWPSTAL